MRADVVRELIEQATEVMGSQRKLAAFLEIAPSSLIQMKQGTRPANWRVRGKLRVALGMEPAHAFVEAIAEDLELSQDEDEKKAADGFKAMLAAFPDDWRKRMISLAPGALEVVAWLGGAVHSALCGGLRTPEFQA